MKNKASQRNHRPPAPDFEDVWKPPINIFETFVL